jgi:electron transfer flavoprotein alpha subunit
MKSFIYVEPSVDGIDSTVKQILSRLREVPRVIRGSLIGIGIGDPLEGKESALKGLCDELIRVEVPTGSESNMEMVSNILAEVVNESGPGVLFLGFTHQGMELGPSVGWRLGIPVVTGCVDLDWGENQCCVKRPILGGKCLISLALHIEHGAVISVQKGAWKEDPVSGEVDHPFVIRGVSWRNSWAAEKTEMLGISEESAEGEENITKAEVLVSVGRGLGDPENLPVMKELADKLGGMISCSRPVVDLGWLPASRQVGISGKTVSPVIYLALGISGQSNHLAGMNASRVIIAVNKDPQAPIFNVAHYGVVDDILEFVPELLEQIK